MICGAVQNIQIKPTGGNSSLRSDCTTTLVGSFIGDSTMKRIDISTSKYPNTYALVDDEDFEELSKYKWHAEYDRNCWYVKANFPPTGKQRTTIKMHQIIMGRRLGLEIDHKNGNGLDNRRSVNLRFCTHSQNCQNRQPQGGTSKYKGVSWKKKNGKWQVQIGTNGKRQYLGIFDDEIEAAKCYDRKALKIFGKFACINFNNTQDLGE